MSVAHETGDDVLVGAIDLRKSGMAAAKWRVGKLDGVSPGNNRQRCRRLQHRVGMVAVSYLGVPLKKSGLSQS